MIDYDHDKVEKLKQRINDCLNVCLENLKDYNWSKNNSKVLEALEELILIIRFYNQGMYNEAFKWLYRLEDENHSFFL